MEQQQQQQEDEGVGRGREAQTHTTKLQTDPQLKKEEPPEADDVWSACRRSSSAALQREMRADGAAAGFRSPSFNTLCFLVVFIQAAEFPGEVRRMLGGFFSTNTKVKQRELTSWRKG